MNIIKSTIILSILTVIGLYAITPEVNVNNIVRKINKTNDFHVKSELKKELEDKLLELKGQKLIEAKEFIRRELILETITSV